MSERAGREAAPRRRTRAARTLFAALFVTAGALHLLTPEPFLRIVPPYLPWPRALVLVSGVAELLLGGLLLPRVTRAAAAWGLIALLIAVAPANLQMALDAEAFPTIPAALLWLRLPLQLLLIAWAYAYTGAPRPRRRQRRR